MLIVRFSQAVNDSDLCDFYGVVSFTVLIGALNPGALDIRTITDGVVDLPGQQFT